MEGILRVFFHTTLQHMEPQNVGVWSLNDNPKKFLKYMRWGNRGGKARASASVALDLTSRDRQVTSS